MCRLFVPCYVLGGHFRCAFNLATSGRSLRTKTVTKLIESREGLTAPESVATRHERKGTIIGEQGAKVLVVVGCGDLQVGMDELVEVGISSPLVVRLHYLL